MTKSYERKRGIQRTRMEIMKISEHRFTSIRIDEQSMNSGEHHAHACNENQSQALRSNAHGHEMLLWVSHWCN